MYKNDVHDKLRDFANVAKRLGCEVMQCGMQANTSFAYVNIHKALDDGLTVYLDWTVTPVKGPNGSGAGNATVSFRGNDRAARQYEWRSFEVAAGDVPAVHAQTVKRLQLDLSHALAIAMDEDYAVAS